MKITPALCVLRLVAAVGALSLIPVGPVRGQSCPNPLFLFQTGSASASKCGFVSWIPDSQGIYHYYLQSEVTESAFYLGSLGDFTLTGTLNSDTIQTSSVPGCGVTVIQTNGSINANWADDYGSYIETGYPVEITTYDPDSGFNIPVDVWSVTTSNTIDQTSTTDPYEYSVDPTETIFPFYCAQNYTAPPTITESLTVNSMSYAYYYSDEYSETTANDLLVQTLSNEFTDAMLAALINQEAIFADDSDSDSSSASASAASSPRYSSGGSGARKASFQADFSDWSSGDSTSPASFSLDSEHVSGSGTKVEYCVSIPSSIKNAVYHCQWPEVTTDASGNLISSVIQNVSVVGTGDPLNPAVGAVHILAVPSHPGSIAEGHLTLVKVDLPPPASSPPPPPGRGNPVGGPSAN